jgi:hypothetical protein
MKNFLTHCRLFIQLVLSGLTFLALAGCTLSLVNLPNLIPPTGTPPYPLPPTPTAQPLAGVTFQAAIPAPLLSGESLILGVVDEVTGLGLNPAYYPMAGMDTLHYTVTIPFTMNSTVKYRYLRQGTLPVPETDSTGQPVRYRIYSVAGPGTVEDVVAAWANAPFSGPTGRIAGQVLDASNGTPLANVLVTAAGEQTLSDSTGSFALEGVPAGTHNLVAYALDGMYQTYQQGARVEAGKRTPVKVSLAPAPLVSVVFTVIVPSNTIRSVPIRLAGNLFQLGNTFGDLNGGMNTVATRMPLLTIMPDGRYTLTINLPAGADVRYKYTLGDGFWNGEHDANGAFVLRQLVVPNSQSQVEVQDVVTTWQAGPSSPILFEVSAPAQTPASDIVSIQFNPYGWTEPIPMWSRGNNQWVYELYSPLNMLGTFEYRYCRNDQCGVADDGLTANGQRGRPVSTSLTPQDLQDTINGWTWLKDTAPGSLVGLPVTARAAGFLTGVEFQPGYDPTWQAWQPLAIQNVQGIGANLLVLTPSWTVSRGAPFVFSPVPGRDPLWADTAETIAKARAANLNVALYPQPDLPADANAWWTSVPRDAAWWDAWFNRYQAFVDYHADLAARAGAQTLILGGSWLTPALPGGTLADGSGSGVPSDAATRWSAIVSDVRGSFKGSVYWALSLRGGFQAAPAFVKDLDGIYLLWDVSLGDSANPTVDQMHGAAGHLLDEDVQPFQAGLQKPVILAAAYPSMDGAAQLTLPDAVLFQSGRAQGNVNLQAQADIYQALLAAVNERAWIGGFVSRGYYPPVGLQDASASVHGKPAADVLWYWYPRFLGTAH